MIYLLDILFELNVELLSNRYVKCCKLVNIVIQLFYSVVNILTLVIYNNYNN